MAFDDDQINLVREFAGHAPSVDGLRPWCFVVTGHSIEVHRAPEWSTTAEGTDRHLNIACGAAIEFARMAVRAQGRECVVRLLPHEDGDDTLLATLTVGHGAGVSPGEQRLIAALRHRALGRGRRVLGAGIPVDALDRARDAAAERGCWARVLNRPGDRAAVAALLGEQESRQTLVLLGSDDDGQVEWLRTGRALALVLLTLSASGLVTKPLSPATSVPTTRTRLQHDLGLLGHPQLMLRVA